jgi:hypothetical protein
MKGGKESVGKKGGSSGGKEREGRAEREPAVLCWEVEQSTADQIVGPARGWSPEYSSQR